MGNDPFREKFFWKSAHIRHTAADEDMVRIKNVDLSGCGLSHTVNTLLQERFAAVL